MEPVRVVVRGWALSWWDVAGDGILPYVVRGSQARHLFLRYLDGRKRGLGYFRRTLWSWKWTRMRKMQTPDAMLRPCTEDQRSRIARTVNLLSKPTCLTLGLAGWLLDARPPGIQVVHASWGSRQGVMLLLPDKCLGGCETDTRVTLSTWDVQKYSSPLSRFKTVAQMNLRQSKFSKLIDLTWASNSRSSACA